MRVAFPISRRSDYCLLGPIIEQALARSWTVECWHDYSVPNSGLKAYLFPALEDAPRFRHGAPRLRAYQGTRDADAIRELSDATLVVSLQPPSAILGTASGVCGRPFWVLVQYAIDTFISYRPGQILDCDAIALYSDWWIDWAAEYYEREGAVRSRHALARELRARAWDVGLTELDARDRIDSTEVRARWGLPPDVPVVALLPFAQGVGKASFWPRRVFGEPRRWKQFLYTVARRRFEYWPYIRHGWTDARVVQAVRAFCDRNGAQLLVKSRLKTPIPYETQAVADRCVYDESAYPATILEVLAVSDLCISFYSGGVLEAVSSGVPHVCITFDAEAYCGENREFLGYFRRFFTDEEGGLFQYSGVSTCIGIPEAISDLPTKQLSDFAMSAGARTKYVRKYLSYDDRAGATRIVERAEKAIAEMRVS